MRAVRGARNIPSRIIHADNIILLLVGMGVGIFVAFGSRSPEVLLRFQAGVKCTNLSAPIGGNNRSLLALKGGDPQELEVAVRMLSSTIYTDELVKVDVVLRNKDSGPITIYIPSQSIQIGNNNSTAGINLEISNLINSSVQWVGVPANFAPPTSFTNDLYLLQSHDECFMHYEFTSAQLSGVGEYRIRAHYKNTNPGAIPPAPPGATATPAFSTQGVWAAQNPISSDEIRFSISQRPPTLAPAQ